MVAPVALVHRNKRQHIDGSLEQIKLVAPAAPMKTVFRLTTHGIALVGGGRASTTFVGVTGNAIFIESHEHHVVVLCGFVYHLFADKSI